MPDPGGKETETSGKETEREAHRNLRRKAQSDRESPKAVPKKKRWMITFHTVKPTKGNQSLGGTNGDVDANNVKVANHEDVNHAEVNDDELEEVTDIHEPNGGLQIAASWSQGKEAQCPKCPYKSKRPRFVVEHVRRVHMQEGSDKSSEGQGQGQVQGKSQAKGQTARKTVKRPMNAFLAWAQIERRKMTGTFMDLKELGRRWKALPERERQTHFNRARRLRLLHQKRNQNAKPQAKIKENKGTKRKSYKELIAKLENAQQKKTQPQSDAGGPDKESGGSDHVESDKYSLIKSGARRKPGVPTADEGRKGKSEPQPRETATQDKDGDDNITGKSKVTFLTTYQDSDRYTLIKRGARRKSNSSTPEGQSERLYCVCRGVQGEQRMVACDNESCSIEWFHFVCVGVTSKPKGEWFCPSCRGDSESVMRSPIQAENQVEIQVKSKVETQAEGQIKAQVKTQEETQAETQAGIQEPTSKIDPGEEESKGHRVASEGSSNAIKRFCSGLRREGELIKLRRENERLRSEVAALSQVRGENQGLREEVERLRAELSKRRGGSAKDGKGGGKAGEEGTRVEEEPLDYCWYSSFLEIPIAFPRDDHEL